MSCRLAEMRVTSAELVPSVFRVGKPAACGLICLLWWTYFLYAREENKGLVRVKVLSIFFFLVSNAFRTLVESEKGTISFPEARNWTIFFCCCCFIYQKFEGQNQSAALGACWREGFLTANFCPRMVLVIKYVVFEIENQQILWPILSIK